MFGCKESCIFGLHSIVPPYLKVNNHILTPSVVRVTHTNFDTNISASVEVPEVTIQAENAATAVLLNTYQLQLCQTIEWLLLRNSVILKQI